MTIRRPRAARALPTLLLALAVLCCAAASASAAARPRGATAPRAAATTAPELTGRLLVRVRPGALGQASDSGLRARGVRKEGWQVPKLGLVSVRPLAGQSLGDSAAALRKQSWVRTVEVEHRFHPRFIPNDPTLVTPETTPGTPPGTTQAWWLARENLFAAWDITRGTGAKVAVIDSGIDAAHPEFAGKIANTLDNEPVFDTGPATFDREGHGTHVSALACAAGGNSLGIVGTGLDCKLIVAKSDFTGGSIAQSLVQATDLGADAINMSFGDDGTTAPSPTIIAGLQYAYDRGVVLVAAAANAPVAEQGQPANVLQPTGTGPNINFNRGLSVTSADNNGARSSFAGSGTQISIAGFGNFSSTPPPTPSGPPGIISAWPANPTIIDVGIPTGPDASPPCLCRTVLAGDQRYAFLSGTSMATPQVTGIAALVRHLNPDLSASDVVKVLKLTATRPAGSGWAPDLGWGIVNAGAAVNLARVLDAHAPHSKVRKVARLQRRTRLTLRWEGADGTPAGLVASGLARFDVYRSVNGKRYKRIAKTSKKSKRVRLSRGARYRFYTVAVDKVGNHERKPKHPDVSFRVSG